MQWYHIRPVKYPLTDGRFLETFWGDAVYYPVLEKKKKKLKVLPTAAIPFHYCPSSSFGKGGWAVIMKLDVMKSFKHACELSLCLLENNSCWLGGDSIMNNAH